METTTYNLADAEMRICTYGIFGDKDSLFSHKNEFEKIYGWNFNGEENSFVAPDGEHKLTEKELSDTIAHAMAFFDVIKTAKEGKK